MPPFNFCSWPCQTSKTVIEKALMKAGHEIELVQRHKAVEDIAVAVASILARDEFMKDLRKLRQTLKPDELHCQCMQALAL